jgi:hypothetical protein
MIGTPKTQAVPVCLVAWFLFVGAALQALFPLFDASSKLNRLCSSL